MLLPRASGPTLVGGELAERSAVQVKAAEYCRDVVPDLTKQNEESNIYGTLFVADP